MSKNFWQKLNKPFFVLAPMDDVTDPAFREIIAKYGRPDVSYTEFVSADGLCSKKGKKRVARDLEYSKKQRPIVAQIFGHRPENFYQAAKFIRELGFDGVDINMGCPVKQVVGHGNGSGLIRTPDLAAEIVRETKRGAGDIPVSVKTRLGDTKNTIDEWLPVLLKEKPDVVIIHGRTRKEMSKVPADWKAIARAVEIAKGSETLIIGNGDVKDLNDARKKAEESGVDGVMIGRAVFGNPWLFNPKVNYSKISTKEKLKVILEHTKLFEKMLGDIKNFGVMKKHYKAYVNGFDGAKELRMELMTTNNYQEVKKIVKNFLKESRI